MNVSNISNTSNTSNISSTSILEPYWSLLIVFFALIVFVTMSGNLLVILAVARTPQLQNTTGIFIMSLACADLIVGCVVQPVSSTTLLMGYWPLGNKVCDILTSVDILCVTASTQMLCAIAGVRYVAIIKPLRYKTLLNKRRARFIACVVWMMSVLISFVPVLSGLNWRSTPEAEKCYKDEQCCDLIFNKTYAILSSIISFYMPLLLMIFMYGRMFVIITRQVKMIEKYKQHFGNGNDQQLNQEPEEAELGWIQRQRSTRHIIYQHKALKMLGLIVAAFILCWLPFFVVNILLPFTGKTDDVSSVLLNWLGYFNSCLNPFIYCNSTKYRTSIQNMLHCLKPKRPSLVTVYKQFQLCCPCLSSSGPVGVGCSNHKASLEKNRAESNSQTPTSEAPETENNSVDPEVTI